MKELSVMTQSGGVVAQRAHSSTSGWPIVRVCFMVALLCLIVTCFIAPSLATVLFWGVFIGVVPAVIVIAPGVWRNICPLASASQLARKIGITPGLRIPPKVQTYSPLVSASLLLAIVPLRRVLLDSNGLALGVFLLALLGMASVGGLLFGGKAGWCSQFCPMLQLERFYGANPLRRVRDTHCRPCSGCAKNCYDLSPSGAALADITEGGTIRKVGRTIFAGGMPWLCLAFFTQPDLSSFTFGAVVTLYARILVIVALGIGIFRVIETITQFTSYQIVLAHAVVTIDLYYWFVLSGAAHSMGVDLSVLSYALMATVVAVSMRWLQTARRLEQGYKRRRTVVICAPTRPKSNILQARRFVPLFQWTTGARQVMAKASRTD